MASDPNRPVELRLPAAVESPPSGLVITDYLMSEMTGYAEDLVGQVMDSAGVDLIIRKPGALDQLAAALSSLFMREEDDPSGGGANA